MAKKQTSSLQAALKDRKRKAAVSAVRDLPDDVLALLDDAASEEDILAAIQLRQQGGSAQRPVRVRRDGPIPEPGLPSEYYVKRGRANYQQELAEEAAKNSSLDDLLEMRSRGVSELDARAATAKSRVANIGKIRKSKGWAKAGKIGGGLLGAYLLGDAFSEASNNRALVKEIEGLPAPNPQDILAALEDEELLAVREARLMRNDPEAYAILKGVAVGKTPKNGPAIGAVRIGGTPIPPQITEQNTSDLLSALLR